MVFFLVLVIVLALSAYLYFNKRRDIKEPPLYPGSLPIIGHAFHIASAKDYVEYGKEISKTVMENDGVLLYRLPGITVYLLNDPEDCNTVANFSLEKSRAYDFAKPWLGDALVCAPVSIWKNNRRLTSRAFNQQILDGYIGVFNSQSMKLIQQMEVEIGKGAFDPYHYIEHSSLETVCQTILGSTSDIKNIINMDKYTKAVVDVHECMTQRAKNPIYYLQFLYNFTNLKKRQDEIIQFLNSSTTMVIQFRKRHLLKHSTEVEDKTVMTFKSLLDVLLKCEEESSLTEEQVRNELSGFIAAGYETSACSLFNNLVLIGSFPEVQERVYKELLDVLEPGRDVEKSDLAKLTYLDAVLKETARFLVVAPVVGRRVTEDVTLKNYTIPAGSECLIDVIGLHRHPVWGEDRDKFNPERWLDPSKLPKSPALYSPFGLGRRGCIGKTFAQMYLKITLANFLRHYRVISDYTKVENKYSLVVNPKPGPHLTIARR